MHAEVEKHKYFQTKFVHMIFQVLTVQIFQNERMETPSHPSEKRVSYSDSLRISLREH